MRSGPLLRRPAPVVFALLAFLLTASGCGGPLPPPSPVQTTLYLASLAGGVYQSPNGGVTWKEITPGEESIRSQFKRLALLPDGRMLVAGAAAGLVEIDARGRAHPVCKELEGSDVRCVLVLPGETAVVLAGTGDRGVFRSADSGRTWSATNDGLAGFEVRALIAGPPPAHRVFCATDAGAFASNDRGVSWEQVPSGAWLGDARALAAEPRDGGLIYWGLGISAKGPRIYVSGDGGTTWTKGGDGLPRGPVLALCADPVQRERVYAGTPGGAYMSRDGGRRWKAPGGGLAGLIVYALVRDGVAVYAATSQGPYRMLDDDQTWCAVAEGLPASAATDVLALPR